MRLRKRSPLDTTPAKRGTQKKANDSAVRNPFFTLSGPQVALLLLSDSMKIPGEKAINSVGDLSYHKKKKSPTVEKWRRDSFYRAS